MPTPTRRTTSEEPTTEQPGEAPKAEPVAEPPPPPITELPSAEPELTVGQAFAHRSAREPIVGAFIHTEKLKGETRKLTAEKWKAELVEFVSRER